MIRADLIDLMERTFSELVEINKTKGHDYVGENDALSNFKTQALDAGVMPEQVWLIFFGKHYASIKTYVREGDVASEPIEGRIHDALLYLFLLLALVEEKKGNVVDPEEEITGRSRS